jgi:hypothetical protein
MKHLPQKDYDIVLQFRNDSIKPATAFESIARLQLTDAIQKQAAEHWLLRQPLRAGQFLRYLVQVGLASNLEIVSRASGQQKFVGKACFDPCSATPLCPFRQLRVVRREPVTKHADRCAKSSRNRDNVADFGGR